MKKILITTALLTAAATQVPAQENLSKQLEVTRAYTPRVDMATKLPIAPDMTDTVLLRPEISYRITSTASSTSFSTLPFEAATIGEAPFETQKPLYIRAGVGAPFETALDLYFTPHLKNGAAFGLFANHAGSFSKIVNDLGIKANATEMSNGAGLWGKKQWSRYSLEADATYDNRLYNPYGAANVDHPSVSGATRAANFVYDKRMDRFSLGLARAGVSFGDSFTDLSRFNFRVGVNAGIARGFAESVNHLKQTNFDARFTAARMFGSGKHGFELVLAECGAFDTVEPTTDRPDMSAVTVTFSPRYLFHTDVWSLRAGFDARHISNKGYGQDYLGFAPSIEVRANFAGGGFVPFAGYTSRIVDGDRESLSRRNPYVVAGGPTAWINDARVGFSGDLGDVFSYRVSGGVSLLDEYQLFAGTQVVTLREATAIDYPPMWFTPFAVDGARFTVGAEAAVHNLGGFGARLYGNWNRFTFSDSFLGFTPVGDLPRYDAGMELSYRYKDVFSVRLGAELIGEREYLVRIRAGSTNSFTLEPQPDRYTTGTIAPVIDLTFGADIRAARDFWVFIEGENLANQVLYPYPHYRGLGASVLGGIKVVF